MTVERWSRCSDACGKTVLRRLAGLAVLDALDRLDDLELGALAARDVHGLVDVLAVHGPRPGGAVEGQTVRGSHDLAGIGALGLLDQSLGAVDAGIAVGADD